MNAIILAAGLGSRFKDITQSTHKSLLDIHGTPNLERTLTFLRQANIDNIVIVTGYLHEQFEYLKKKYDCTLIYNEKYREYNSIYSFSLAQDFFNDCYVIDADVVLNRNIFLTKPSHSKYFTVIRSNTHNEWLPILNSNGQVMRIEIGSLNQPIDTKQGKIMKKLTLREQQLVCLDILDYFHALCEKHQIHYSLGGGTLIGAIRHKGFIPWDDDIDVYMHRDEYQKFVDVWLHEKHERYIIGTAEDILASNTGEMTKIFDNKTKTIDINGDENKIFIDIFIYDGIPNNKKIIYTIIKKYRKRKNHFASCKKRWIRASQNSLKYTILNWLSNLLFHRMQNYLSEIQKLYPINTSENIGLLMTEYRNWNKAYMPKEYFNHIVYKEFEGRQFQVMNGYHEHLTQYYGDYMQLPPEEDQKPHHIQEAYIL